MKLSIVHDTTYRYSSPVTLLTHYLRLKPRRLQYIDELDFSISIDPDPVSTSERIDAENNAVIQFQPSPTEVETLKIRTELKIITTSFNPFNFIMDPPPKFEHGQFHYSSHLSQILHPYRIKNHEASFEEYLSEITKESQGDFLSLSTNLLTVISQSFSYETKYDDIRSDSDEILKSKSGSCKEISWMLIEMLRSIGVAARFVSGYAFNASLGEGHELHAWVEVFLEGAGWIGVDPVSGLYTDERYIPLASSFDPEFTMPVSGSFGGNATSKLDTSVSIEVI